MGVNLKVVQLVRGGGAVVNAEHSTEFENLMHCANAALAEAKRTGRCVIYRAEMRAAQFEEGRLRVSGIEQLRR